MLIGAAVGAAIGFGARVATNIATGEKWSNGVLGAAAGGATYGLVLTTTANPIAAGFASAAAEEGVNQIVSYTGLSEWNGSGQQKELTSKNVIDSLVSVGTKTAINGGINALAGGMAGRIIPTNPNWIKPQKLVSSLIGNYARKAHVQTAIQGGLIGGAMVGMNVIDFPPSQKSAPTTRITPLTGTQFGPSSSSSTTSYHNSTLSSSNASNTQTKKNYQGGSFY